MMETVSTSEESINFYETTRRKIPEDSHLLGLLLFGRNPKNEVSSSVGYKIGNFSKYALKPLISHNEYTICLNLVWRQ
jgi:hypothetical protein